MINALFFLVTSAFASTTYYGPSVTPGVGIWDAGGSSVSVNGSTIAITGLNSTALATESTLSTLNGKVTACNTGAVTVGAALPSGTNNIGIATRFKATRSDTFTGTTSGTTIDVSASPTQSYAIAIKGTGASATTWDVRLEGSLDNTNFTQILQHTNTIGDGVALFSGSALSPALYIRSRVSGLVLGGATNIVVTILGIQ